MLLFSRTFTQGDKNYHPHNCQVEGHLELDVAEGVFRGRQVMPLENDAVEVIRDGEFDPMSGVVAEPRVFKTNPTIRYLL